MSTPRLTAVLVAEAIGTFLFVFIGAGSVVLGSHVNGGDAGGLVGVAFAHGLALAVLISALGPISGGHFNPAVTFGVWITGYIDAARAGMYVLAQLLGAAAGALALRMATRHRGGQSPSALRRWTRPSGSLAPSSSRQF